MTGSRRQPTLRFVVAFVLLTGVALMATLPTAQAADTPRRGGVLLAAIGADPPSLDPHQESTFANIQLVAPLYSTLLQMDPLDSSKIIGDAGSEWKTSPDGLTVTVKVRPNIKFHDGSVMTSADVKATYDKIVFPPQGVRFVIDRDFNERVQALWIRERDGRVQLGAFLSAEEKLSFSKAFGAALRKARA